MFISFHRVTALTGTSRDRNQDACVSLFSSPILSHQSELSLLTYFAPFRPGDQHQATANPFEEPRARVSEYTASEAAALQQRLEKKLGPEFLSSRPGPSGKAVHYLAAEKCIALANEVFGFNGWSSAIQNIQVDYVDEHPQTLRVSLGISVVVRVTLRDGTFHEDIGYGKMENCKGKAVAFEKAKKEATTDALKRALRHFGNVMGNCIYDADYVKKVSKIKVGPGRFSLEDLHRHTDFVEPPPAVVKEEPRTVAPQPVVEQSADLTEASTLKIEPSDSFDEFMGGLLLLSLLSCFLIPVYLPKSCINP